MFRFSLLLGGERIPLDTGEPPVVNESDQVAFELVSTSDVPSAIWRIRLGDVLAEDPLGSDFETAVLWRRAAWFDCCRGTVTLSLERNSDLEGSAHGIAGWEVAMAANVRVRPAKLTDDEWLAMRADLEAVAVDLANDLVGKAKAGAAKAIRARTPLDDLAAARQLMVRLDRATSEIGQQPYTVLKSTTERAKRPPRRLDAVTLKKLLARGIDPRRCPTSMSGLVAERRPITSTDVREHREIVGTLRAASRTLVDGEWRARIEIGEIEADRPWRERPLDAPGTSLYERLDYPRVQRLRQFLGESTNLRKWAARIINLPVLYGLRPEMKPQATQVSRHCPPYRLAFRAILAWRLAGRVQIDVGNLIRRKDTDRMYEQWVFLQLVAGLQFIGFILERQEDVFRKISQRRYLVDLPRGAHLGFRGPSEARVDIYFEPWIGRRGLPKG